MVRTVQLWRWRYFLHFIDLTFHTQGTSLRRHAVSCLSRARDLFFFPLTRVTACTSVFVTRQCETWHGVMNRYVDRVSVPYSDLNLIGCPCNRGFVPLLMYLPHRPSETSRWHKGSRSWQCVLPRQFHTTAESISRKSQVWPWTRLRLDLFPFWMHHTQRRGGSKAIPHGGSSAYPSQVV